MKLTFISLGLLLTTAAAHALSPQEARVCLRGDNEVRQVTSEIREIVNTWPFDWTEVDQQKMNHFNEEAASRAANCREYAEGLRAIQTRLTTYIRNGGTGGQRREEPRREEPRREEPRREEPRREEPRREEPRREEPRREEPRRQEPRASRGTTILILTDEASGRGASTVRNTLLSTAPFSCFDLDVQVQVLTAGELDCRPGMDRNRRTGIVECHGNATRIALQKKREANAKRVMIVTVSQIPGGNGGRVRNGGAVVTEDAVPVVTTAILSHPSEAWRSRPKAGIHELMHTMGFVDSYGQIQRDSEGNYTNTQRTAEFSPRGGPIMLSSDAEAYVPREDWGKIARALGTEVPSSCGSANRY